MGKSKGPAETDFEQPLIYHLLELRNRLLKIVLAILSIFLGLTFYANELYDRLAGPLMAHLPTGTSMVAIDVASPFFTPFKLALIVSIFASVPIILYQVWA
ncbi:MAG: twin-arginine translocase subunit TatC, partial [Methylococcales bacterium]